MKTQSIQPKRNGQCGLSLIEMIGILAVLAILASILVPAFIRKLDQIARDKESASLKLLADAFQASILRHRYIPSHTNWAERVALERGVNLNDVTTNLRRQPRVFLIDPALQIGGNMAGEPYQQNNFGSVIIRAGRVVPPIKPRMILLSSISEPLPAGIVSGMPPSTNDFDAVWNTVEGELPASSLWAGWRGAGDLRIQRINLSSLFVRLVLTSYASDGDGLYSIDGGGSLTNAPDANTDPFGRDAYFLQSSALHLHKHTGELETKQILTRDMSFVYQQNVWRASIEGLGFAGGMDIGTIVDRFLRAPHNPRAEYGVNGDRGQIAVVEAFLAYMQAYQDWEAAGFPDYSSTLWKTADQKQKDMIIAVQALYKHPDNSPTEVPCPP